MDKELVRFVQEQLFVIVGFSDRNISEYIVSLALKAKNTNDLYQKVIANDVPDNSATLEFCKQLYGKILVGRGGKSGGASSSSRSSSQISTNADLIRASESYGMVSMDDEDAAALLNQENKHRQKKAKKRDRPESTRGDSSSSSSSSSSSKGHSSKHDHKSRRDRHHQDEGSSEDETVIKRKAMKPSEEQGGDTVPLTEEEEKQKQMDADIAERDAFVTRMLEREDKKTKKLAGEGQKGLTNEEIQELATTGTISVKQETTTKSTVDQLREISRQHYLEKREEKELKLLEMGMRDEADLFDGLQLTAEERKRQELQQQILSMAKDKYRFSYKDEGYHIPDSYEDEHGRIDQAKRQAALTARYEEDEQVKTEQEQWEDDQVKKSSVHFGAKDKGGAGDDAYELLMEDQIDFISHEVLKGTRKEGDKALYENKGDYADAEEEEEAKELTAHEKILVGRKKLPIYAYRDEFLEAVQDNKILVVVGETGSGKTTQIPQYLHEAGWSKLGKIGCTQPRRVAAMSVSARVSQEMNVKVRSCRPLSNQPLPTYPTLPLPYFYTPSCTSTSSHTAIPSL